MCLYLPFNGKWRVHHDDNISFPHIVSSFQPITFTTFNKSAADDFDEF